MPSLFSTTYFGSIPYYAALVQCEQAFIDASEPWEKQSYRNRCYIDSPNGKLMLNVPIDHTKSGKTCGEVYVSNDENWRSKHWQALKTTYNLSPFFDEAGPIFKDALFKDEQNLFQVNWNLMQAALYCLRVSEDKVKVIDEKGERENFKAVEGETSIQPQLKRLSTPSSSNFSLLTSDLLSQSSDSQLPSSDLLDLKQSFHPKREAFKNLPEYPQAFDHKHGFLSNLSILDLIFNEGPAAFDYLHSL